MRFLSQWESYPALCHRLQEHGHSSERLWLWDHGWAPCGCSIWPAPSCSRGEPQHHKISGGPSATASFPSCAMIRPQEDTGNIILSRASVLFNVSLHSIWIKTNRNYLSPAGLFLYLSACFSSLFGSKVEIYFQGIHLRAYVVCVHNTLVISSSAFS